MSPVWGSLNEVYFNEKKKIIKDNQNYLSNYFCKVFYMLYKEGNEKRRKGENREQNKGREKEED